MRNAKCEMTVSRRGLWLGSDSSKGSGTSEMIDTLLIFGRFNPLMSLPIPITLPPSPAHPILRYYTVSFFAVSVLFSLDYCPIQATYRGLRKHTTSILASAPWLVVACMFAFFPL
jgi:hypothetical protein